MKRTSGNRALLASGAIILLCLTIIIGSTWALFTDTQTVKNHLKAGDLSITLERTNLVKTTLDEEGYLFTTEPYEKRVDFSDPSSENVFGLGSEELIVPGSKFVATMQISNYSDVAFGYWIEIVCDDAAALADQIKATVTIGDENFSAVIGKNILKVTGNDSPYIGELAIDEWADFVVTVEFLDSHNGNHGLAFGSNDGAQGQSIDFDLIVHAVQLTSKLDP